MTAIIYKSDIHDAVQLSAQSSTVLVGGDGVNMLAGTTYTEWRPDAIGQVTCVTAFDLSTAQLFDSFAIDAHNLNDIEFTSISFRGSNTSNFVGEEYLALFTKAQIVNGTNILEFVNATAFRYLRIVIVAVASFTVAPIIGVMYAGLKIELPEGIKPIYTPPRYGNMSKITNNKSGTNNFIGRSVIRSGYEFIIKNENVDVSWMTTNWNELYNYIEHKPFFYLWNDLYTEEGVFCWTTGKIGKPKYTDQCNMSFSIKCEGLKQ